MQLRKIKHGVATASYLVQWQGNLCRVGGPQGIVRGRRMRTRCAVGRDVAVRRAVGCSCAPCVTPSL